MSADLNILVTMETKEKIKYATVHKILTCVTMLKDVMERNRGKLSADAAKLYDDIEDIMLQASLQEETLERQRDELVLAKKLGKYFMEECYRMEEVVKKYQLVDELVQSNELELYKTAIYGNLEKIQKMKAERETLVEIELHKSVIEAMTVLTTRYETQMDRVTSIFNGKYLVCCAICEILLKPHFYLGSRLSLVNKAMAFGDFDIYNKQAI